MPSPKKFKPTENHRTSFAKIADDHLTLSLYGKVIDDISVNPIGVGLRHPEGDGALRVGHVYGYSQSGECFRFTPPRIYMLPDPDGPADGCGWDPTEFVVWKVPPDWLTVHFEIRSGTIGGTLAGNITNQSRLSAGQCLTISSDCVFDETGNPQPVDPSRSLNSYGINTSEQASGVRRRVVASPTLGVPRFNFQIDPNALKDLSGSWTLGQLSDRIQDTAVPA